MSGVRKGKPGHGCSACRVIRLDRPFLAEWMLLVVSLANLQEA